MTIFNFHTHDATAHDAIISTVPSHYTPQSGLFYSVGIHPWDTCGDLQHDWELLETICHHDNVVAIGETGLDTLRGASLDIQIELFKLHIALADNVGKPLIVHCVRAWQELIALWRATAPHHVPLAVHGFRGNANIVNQLTKEGFYLSFGEHFNIQALQVTPRARILVENDDSATHIASIAASAAKALGISTEEFATLTSDNAHRFLSIHT